MIAAEDHLDILNLYARYAHTLDRGDVAGWCACFTEAGHFEIPARSVSALGQEQLAAFAENYWAGTRANGSEKHVITNILLEPDGDAVSGNAYLCMVVDGSPTAPSRIRTTGRYRDVLVRRDVGWRFAYRMLLLDGPL